MKSSIAASGRAVGGVGSCVEVPVLEEFRAHQPLNRSISGRACNTSEDAVRPFEVFGSTLHTLTQSHAATSNSKTLPNIAEPGLRI